MSHERKIFDRELLRRRAREKHGQEKNKREKGEDKGDLDSVLSRHAAKEILQKLRDTTRDFPRALAWGEDAAMVLREAGRSERFLIASSTHEGEGVLADEERLPFEEQSFDLALSLMSLHFVNDLPGALIQIRRALKPDGLFLGALLGGETLRELRHALLHAESDKKGAAHARVMPFPDLRAAGDLLPRAGLALPVADRDLLTLRYKNMGALLDDVRHMGVGNIMRERARGAMRRDVLKKAAQIYEERFCLPEGGIAATFEILYLTGWAKAETQPQPLKPGSATTSLKSALQDIRQKRETKKPR